MPARLGLVGYGAIARDHLAALERVPDLALAGIADPDAAAAARARAETRVPVVASLAELLRTTELDAVLVTAPPRHHEALACEALAAGKHVLCEKPLAIDAAGARRMLAQAERARRHLVMASKFRFVSDVRAAARLVREGVLGEPVLYQNVFCSRVAMGTRWNGDPRVSGGGVLIDNGAHAADLAHLLLGRIERVMARFAPRVQPVEVEDTVRVLFETRAGCLGTIDLSWSVHRELEWYATLEGSKGTLRLGWRDSVYKLAGDPGWTRFGTGYDKRAALAANLLEFAHVVRGEASPAPSPGECLDSVLVIDACYRAAREGAWTAVHPEPELPA